jgi:hypothetical protein
VRWHNPLHRRLPQRKKLDSSSNKYDYIKRNDYSKSNDKKRYRFRDKKKKKFQKMMSRACAALSDLDFSSDDSSSSEEDEMPKRKMATSPAFASLAKLHGTSLTLTPM